MNPTEKIKQCQEMGEIQGKDRVPILTSVIQEDLSHKVTSEQKLDKCKEAI
jgi:hypothetical protein